MSGVPDPFARVILCPVHNVAGSPAFDSQETEIIYRTCTPQWNNSMLFDLDWRRALSSTSAPDDQQEPNEASPEDAKGPGGVPKQDLQLLRDLQARVQRLRVEHHYVSQVPSVPNAPRSTQNLESRTNEA